MKKGKDYIGVGVGAVLVNDKAEVLLLLRKKAPEAGCWSIPGGTVEFGETIEDALLRELKEELGIESQIIKLLRVTNHILKDEKIHWVSPCFLVKTVSGVPENRETDAHSSLAWFSVSSLPKNFTLTTELAIQSYLDDLLNLKAEIFFFFLICQRKIFFLLIITAFFYAAR